MEIEESVRLWGRKRREWEALMRSFELDINEPLEYTLLMWDDGDRLAATASLCGNIIKCVAVSAEHQGEGLTATLVTRLRTYAFSQGLTHLFLYTKPKNIGMFSDLFFYPVAQTENVLLMETEKDGVRRFLKSLPRPKTDGVIGACVMNCNPFTRGHEYLVKKAASMCDFLYIFVLSEDKSLFPAADRLELVRRGTADMKSVCVLPSGPYLISAATFPNYFLKDRDSCEQAHCALDVEIFAQYYAPHFGITRRFVGTEPLSALTDQYNRELLRALPEKGIEVFEIPRLEMNGVPVSATAVRDLIGKGQPEALSRLLPDTTFAYFQEHNLI